MLDREELVEQAYLFRALGERMEQQISTQELLETIKEELLTTTKLPLAIDFLSAELKLRGVLATAMARLPHYFTPYQTFVVEEAEKERGRFDFGVALEILRAEAEYRAAGASPQGVFLYQFETLCRNRLGYDRGLTAMSGDPIYDEAWRQWLLMVRRQVGLVDIADLIFVRSPYYAKSKGGRLDPEEASRPVLFGEKEGRIALANRHKDPLLLFSALQRHLGYPAVPRTRRADESKSVVPALQRRMDRVEQRLKLLEEEGKGGIDLSKFFARPDRPPTDDTT
jgi:hypothetical protein